MATLMYLKCSKCRGELTLIRTFSGGDAEFLCAGGHQKVYSAKYLRRFTLTALCGAPKERAPKDKCPSCGREALPRAEGWYCSNCDTYFDSEWQPRGDSR